MSDYFDPDDITKANYTPPLRKVTPVYTSADTPPPLVPEDTSPSSAGTTRNRATGNSFWAASGKNNLSGRRKTRPSQCDTVLINQLANHNRPDIANLCGTQALESASQSEGEDEEEVYERSHDEEAEQDSMLGIRNGEHAINRMSNKVMAMHATEALKRVILNNNNEIEMIEAPQSLPDEDDKLSDSSVKIRREPEPLPSYRADQVDSPTPKVSLDVRPPPRTVLPPITTTQPFSPRPRNEEDDSIPISPALAKFAIPSAYGDPDSVLPAMQKSPPRSSSCQSPESMQTLPSLKAALSQVSDTSSSSISHYSSATSQSPNITRPSPSHHGHFVPTPSSYSQPSPHMSPPRIPHTSGPYGWRSTTRDNSGSTTTPSDYQSQSHSTPSSTLTSQSPASGFPTPNPHHEQNGSVNDNTSVNGASPTSNGMGSNSSSYRCNYLGCTAAPFQTQYLLNSHANVHSSSRPHFCPVDKCPRGPGGKGFKRKNEMIRHGLVHESPGYQCPFCPDQTHKYPRPDNLQRHVRVHHTDKDKDDPLLRQVLAQRPEGGNRGRRRRI